MVYISKEKFTDDFIKNKSLNFELYSVVLYNKIDEMQLYLDIMNTSKEELKNKMQSCLNDDFLDYCISYGSIEMLDLVSTYTNKVKDIFVGYELSPYFLYQNINTNHIYDSSIKILIKTDEIRKRCSNSFKDKLLKAQIKELKYNDEHTRLNMFKLLLAKKKISFNERHMLSAYLFGQKEFIEFFNINRVSIPNEILNDMQYANIHTDLLLKIAIEHNMLFEFYALMQKHKHDLHLSLSTILYLVDTLDNEKDKAFAESEFLNLLSFIKDKKYGKTRLIKEVLSHLIKIDSFFLFKLMYDAKIIDRKLALDIYDLAKEYERNNMLLYLIELSKNNKFQKNNLTL